MPLSSKNCNFYDPHEHLLIYVFICLMSSMPNFLTNTQHLHSKTQYFHSKGG
jgi:hypothetical protein